MFTIYYIKRTIYKDRLSKLYMNERKEDNYFYKTKSLKGVIIK